MSVLKPRTLLPCPGLVGAPPALAGRHGARGPRGGRPPARERARLHVRLGRAGPGRHAGGERSALEPPDGGPTRRRWPSAAAASCSWGRRARPRRYRGSEDARGRPRGGHRAARPRRLAHPRGRARRDGEPGSTSSDVKTEEEAVARVAARAAHGPQGPVDRGPGLGRRGLGQPLSDREAPEREGPRPSRLPGQPPRLRGLGQPPGLRARRHHRATPRRPRAARS